MKRIAFLLFLLAAPAFADDDEDLIEVPAYKINYLIARVRADKQVDSELREVIMDVQGELQAEKAINAELRTQMKGCI